MFSYLTFLLTGFCCLVDAFHWRNVHTGGGGGFVPGIVFNTGAPGVAYARTDIGGLYRLNADDSWTPLTDFADAASWHDWGIDAVATDPIHPENVYAAAGLYTNSWDWNNGSILKSRDRGDTWTSTALPFKVGGNMPGRGMGERLAIDPVASHVIYFGARSGNGLWKSIDSGDSFQAVVNFPNVGPYRADGSGDQQGIAWITFDPSSGTTNGVTSRIFVGVADNVGPSIYVSNNGGASWEAVSGQPYQTYLPHKGKISPLEHALYISYSDGSGPHGGTHGSVWRYDINKQSWRDISPMSVSGSPNNYGYGGLSVDIKRPGVVMVASLNNWWPDGQIFRSTDSGKTWSPLWEMPSYPKMDYFYTMSNADAPWIPNRKSIDCLRLGWWMETLEIDPFDSNHWLYGTGMTIKGGRDLLKWDTEHMVSLANMAKGVEETAVVALTHPPGGSLVSAVGDVGGFLHTDLTVAPAAMLPLFSTSTDVDYAGNKPKSLVRAGNDGTANTCQIAMSQDGGSTWYLHQGGGGPYGGNVAISADASTILWSSSNDGVFVAHGADFASVNSLPAGAVIASDKRAPHVFYGGSGGNFYVSTTSADSFTITTKLGSSTLIHTIRVNPSQAGDVWVSTDTGLFHSTDQGHSFTAINGPTAGKSFALGKLSESPYGYAIYGFFTIHGTPALWRSRSVGQRWGKISSEKQGFGSGGPVAASQDTQGLVYVGTNGRGIFYGSPRVED